VTRVLAFVVAVQALSGQIQGHFNGPGGRVYTVTNATLDIVSGIPVFKASVLNPEKTGLDSLYLDISSVLACGTDSKVFAFTAAVGNIKPGENQVSDTVVSARDQIAAECHLKSIEASFRSGKFVSAAIMAQREEDSLTASQRTARAAATQKAKQEEERQLRQKCSEIYRATSNKKVVELTVAEDRAIKACEALGIYEP